MANFCFTIFPWIFRKLMSAISSAYTCDWRGWKCDLCFNCDMRCFSVYLTWWNEIQIFRRVDGIIFLFCCFFLFRSFFFRTKSEFENSSVLWMQFIVSALDSLEYCFFIFAFFVCSENLIYCLIQLRNLIIINLSFLFVLFIIISIFRFFLNYFLFQWNFLIYSTWVIPAFFFCEICLQPAIINDKMSWIVTFRFYIVSN